MIKLSALIYFTFLFGSVKESNCKSVQSLSMDSIFVAWNKVTFESINRQAKLVTDSIGRHMYENRLLTIKGYWGIESIEDSNDSSIRYQFMEAFFLKLNGHKKGFYIIEANESGAKVLLRNFVLYIDSTSTVNIEFYIYVNGKWRRQSECKKNNLLIADDLKSYITRFGRGFNYDDLVVTEFRNGRIKESEYYLYSTLSRESSIKDVLDSYRKENFAK